MAVVHINNYKFPRVSLMLRFGIMSGLTVASEDAMGFPPLGDFPMQR